MNLNGRKDGLLHVRGGVSLDKMWLRVVPPSSPRPWRCFFPQAVHANDHRVFSTSVEVFPRHTASTTSFWGLLHVRGGVSLHWLRTVACDKSSPRPWRCFHNHIIDALRYSVFSTSVEVFPNSELQTSRNCRLLHVRGGVSQDAPIKKGTALSFLHVRGGVSSQLLDATTNTWSSPRPWRCFVKHPEASSLEYRLLHVRGGVSLAGYNGNGAQ